MPSYHDLYITTADIPRTSIFNLPLNLMVTCTRTGGWELWSIPDTGLKNAKLLAGEFNSSWLVLDVAGCQIVSRRSQEETSGQVAAI